MPLTKAIRAASSRGPQTLSRANGDANVNIKGSQVFITLLLERELTSPRSYPDTRNTLSYKVREWGRYRTNANDRIKCVKSVTKDRSQT